MPDNNYNERGEGMKTPCYTVHLDTFEKNCRDVMNAFEAAWNGNVQYGYSVKTNHDAALMKYAHAKLGWFIETVSPDEYNYALDLGFDPENIIFNGPCKKQILKDALRRGAYVNLDNLDEVMEVCTYAEDLDASRLGIRVNFDLEAVCPGETTAGDSVSRFGIDCENGDFGKAVDMLKNAGIEPAGLHMHTSTKTRSAGVFAALAAKAAKLVQEYNLKLKFVDMGGGYFGGQKVPGKPDMEQYADVITSELKKVLSPDDTTLILEPGASVIATSVTYEASVLSVRDIRGTKVVTLDGTLLHVNPFMAHRNQPYTVLSPSGSEIMSRTLVPKQIICGCTCMENDRFAEICDDYELQKGDILSFKYAGAYTMAFNSDFIIKPAEVVYETDSITEG